MLDDVFMDGLLERTLHGADDRRGWVEFKGDHMVADIARHYGPDEAESQSCSRGRACRPAT